eukprot:2371148-Rhodomonas_salina.5
MPQQHTLGQHRTSCSMRLAREGGSHASASRRADSTVPLTAPGWRSTYAPSVPDTSVASA